MSDTRIRSPRGFRRAKTLRVIAVTSPAFSDGGEIPRRHLLNGDNRSPALSWSTLPDGTEAVAVICEDPDADGPEPFLHWLLYNAPPMLTGFPEGISQESLPGEVPGAAQGVNDFGNIGYDGPSPPEGSGVHRYRFQVFALDESLELPPGASAPALWSLMKDHVLAKGVLVGRYGR